MRAEPSRMSDQATTKFLGLAPLVKPHPVASDSTRKVAPGKCGHPSVAGSELSSETAPVTIAFCASKVLPPSVERTYCTVLPLYQAMCTVPSAPTEISGAKQESTILVPVAVLPNPVQVTPWLV